MKTASPLLRGWTLASLAAAPAVCVLALSLFAWQNRALSDAPKKEEAKKDETRSWPMYGGDLSRNFVNLVEKNIPTTWSVKNGAEKNIKWSQKLGTEAYGGPIVAGGKVFVGSNNGVPRNKRDEEEDGTPIDKSILMCFDEKSGDFLWQYVSDKLPSGRESDWPKQGLCSSPVVEGDRVYFVSNRAELLCLTTEGLAAGNQGVTDEKYHDTTKGQVDGDVVWRLDMIDKLGVFPHNIACCSPLIVADLIFIVTGNGVDKDHKKIPAPEAPSFIAVDKKTGELKWKSNAPGNNIMHGQWSNPVYAEPNGKPMVVFPGGDGWMRAFDPKSGDLIWKFDCNPKDAFYELGPAGTKNDFVGTPVVWENKLYIGVGQDPEHHDGVGHLWCIDITKEPKNKDKDLSPAFKPPAKEGKLPETIFDPKDPANKDSGLVWHLGGFDKREGATRPFYFGRTMSTCAVHDGLVYAAEMEGYLHCLDAQTGQEYWQHQLAGKANTWSSPFWVDGKIYLGDDKGKITIFKHGKTKEVVGQVDFGRGSLVRVTPVACNGVLYVISESPCKLWAIAEK
jgi:outer membrane protein assembly factor BamB